MLNDRQVRWVEQMLVTGNATESARRAGYRDAHRQGMRMSRNVTAQKLLAAGRQERAEKAEIDADWVLAQLRKRAEDTDLKNPAAVKSIELIGKHIGMFEQRLKVELAYHPEFQALLTKITAALNDHPEAAAAVAQALGEDEA